MFDGMKKEGICLLQNLRKQVETKTMTAPEELYRGSITIRLNLSRIFWVHYKVSCSATLFPGKQNRSFGHSYADFCCEKVIVCSYFVIEPSGGL